MITVLPAVLALQWKMAPIYSHCFILIMKINYLRLIIDPQGVLIEAFTVTVLFLFVAELNAEKVKVDTKSYDNFVLLWLSQMRLGFIEEFSLICILIIVEDKTN